MASHIKREIIFNVLCGSCGNRFLQSVIGTNRNGEIYDINTWIKRNFKESFTVEDIAKQNNMSVSQFIRDYKKMFGNSPKDDIKILRSRFAGTGKNKTESGK